MVSFNFRSPDQDTASANETDTPSETGDGTTQPEKSLVPKDQVEGHSRQENTATEHGETTDLPVPANTETNNKRTRTKQDSDLPAKGTDRSINQSQSHQSGDHESRSSESEPSPDFSFSPEDDSAKSDSHSASDSNINTTQRGKTNRLPEGEPPSKNGDSLTYDLTLLTPFFFILSYLKRGIKLVVSLVQVIFGIAAMLAIYGGGFLMSMAVLLPLLAALPMSPVDLTMTTLQDAAAGFLFGLLITAIGGVFHALGPADTVETFDNETGPSKQQYSGHKV